MGEKNSTGVEYILLNAKRRKRHYFERVEIRTCHMELHIGPFLALFFGQRMQSNVFKIIVQN